MPPWACSNVPTLRWPPVPWTPASTPNSSISTRSGAMVAALMATNGAASRFDWAWISRATTSLPEPGGPEISTRLPVGATRLIALRTWVMAALPPISA